MTDFYSQNRCVCSTRSHGPLLCAFCLSFHAKPLFSQLTTASHHYKTSFDIAIVEIHAVVS